MSISKYKRNSLKPFLKWPGGKSKELKYIIPSLPKVIQNYYEPFVGGGAVYFSIDRAEKYYINDKSEDLIELYHNVADHGNREFINTLLNIDRSWSDIEKVFDSFKEDLIATYESYRKDINKEALKDNISIWLRDRQDYLLDVLPKPLCYDVDIFLKELKSNLLRKLSRMFVIEGKKGRLSDLDVELNILTALKSALYMYYRHLHNNQEELESHLNSAIYYFIRNYTYSSMFRYNSKGQFNVPYGGMGYNSNRLTDKISYLDSDILKKRLKNTIIENLDFFDFFKNKDLSEDDFVFLDPPYDTEFSTYDKNTFGIDDQKRLANLLINRLQCKWMLVIKNTEFIYDLYCNKKDVHIHHFDKTYAVSFMNRNNRDTEHLLITNYEI